MKFNAAIAVLVIFAAVLSGSLLVPTTARADWPSGDWSYRHSVAIQGSDSVLTDYQVKVIFSSAQYLVFSLAKDNGEDLRFTGADTTTLLNYWIEKWDKANYAGVVWVKVPLIPVEGTTLQLYFGNPAASSAVDGTGTFEFFEDFEAWGRALEAPWVEKKSLPTGIADEASAVFNGKLYIFGGYGTSVTNYLRLTYEYDPSTDIWTRKADLPTARWGPVAVEFDGLIHVFAGTAGDVHEVYDPSTNTWSTWSSVPHGLGDQGLMGVRYGDKIHLFYKWYHYEYDPVTDEYARKADVPTWRTWGTCAVVDDKIYVIGGFSYGPGPTGAVNVNEVYDPLTDTWTAKTPMPVAKYGVARENPVINGKIYLNPGLDGGFHTDNYAYDPATDSWEEKSPSIHFRDGVAGGVIDGKLYSVGGRDRFKAPRGIVYTEMYDPSLDTLTTPLHPDWTLSRPDKVMPYELGKYEGSYGLVIDDDIPTNPYAEHYHNFSAMAVDLYWNLTDEYSEKSYQPQGRILFTGSAGQGSLYFYRDADEGPRFKWYNGTFKTLENGSYNTWYPVTIIWNSGSSRVIIDGHDHSVWAPPVSSDRIRLDSAMGEITKEFFDLVRVRKYRWPEPEALVQVDQVGVNPGPAAVASPNECVLEQAFPNPFNPETAVRFVTGRRGRASLEIYNLRGQLVRTLLDGDIDAGTHSILWNGTDNMGVETASGIYICTLKFNSLEISRKLTLIK